jgi:hypothetical protein
MTTVPMTYADATAAITRHLVDRDAYVLITAVDQASRVARRLAKLPAWTAYMINYTEIVLRTDDPAIVGVLDVCNSTTRVVAAALFTVPKTISAASLGSVLGVKLPDDEHDVFNLQLGRDVHVWPALFVDALAPIDPEFVTAMYANHFRQVRS